jgi:hypothetical protein
MKKLLKEKTVQQKYQKYIVPKVDNFEITIGSPHYGWLPIRIILGNYHLDLEASNVLNDPLAELIDWVTFVKEGVSGFRRVCFWLEPGGYALDVQLREEQSVVITVLFAKDFFFPPMANSHLKEKYRCLVPKKMLLDALILCLAQWIETESNTMGEHWTSNIEYYRQHIQQLKS